MGRPEAPWGEQGRPTGPGSDAIAVMAPRGATDIVMSYSGPESCMWSKLNIGVRVMLERIHGWYFDINVYISPPPPKHGVCQGNCG